MSKKNGQRFIHNEPARVEKRGEVSTQSTLSSVDRLVTTLKRFKDEADEGAMGSMVVSFFALIDGSESETIADCVEVAFFDLSKTTKSRPVSDNDLFTAVHGVLTQEGLGQKIPRQYSAQILREALRRINASSESQAVAA